MLRFALPALGAVLLAAGCAGPDRAPGAPPAQASRADGAPGLAVTTPAAADLPPGTEYEGHLVTARRWRDSLGDNLLLLTLTDVRDGPCTPETSCGASQDMYGYHFLVGSAARPTRLWRTRDFIRDCDLDMEFRIRPGAVEVTDLDADGTAETTYMYMMACRGDVSPGALKLIMHEGAAKYAIRGAAELTAGPMHVPSEMTLDPGFEQAPAFRSFAVAHWRRHQDMDLWSGP